jgi:uncharacterized protein GlcG (DUF336 family)
MPDKLHEPWHIKGAPGVHWVALVRNDGAIVAQPIRRREAAAILRWQHAYRKAATAAMTAPAKPTEGT